jgi:outer membrane lipoprotein carrier protein
MSLVRMSLVRLTGVVCLGAPLVAGGPISAQQDPTVVLNRAVAAYAHVTTAQGTFEQSLTNPLTGTAQLARGDFVQERPSHLAVHFSEPSGDMIIADGKWLWVYVPSSTPGQVIRMPVNDGKTTSLEGTGTVSVDYIAQFLTGPTTRYAVTGVGPDTVGGRTTYAIVLVPRQSGQITKAKLWVDDADGAVRQFEVTDASGTLRHVRVIKETFNGPVDRSKFAFTPPHGVKVVNQAAVSSGAD